MIEEVSELRKKAKWVRRQVLTMCAHAGEGRVASSLSCADILVALYYGGIFHFIITNQRLEERDRFILSKGQGFPALAAILADIGFIPRRQLDRFCEADGILGPYGECEGNIPGVEAVWGSLGHGLGVAAGLALADKMDRRPCRTVVLLGDGECYEGSIWEAAMFAAHHQLSNLLAIIDRNGLCVTDFTEHCLRLEPLEEKFRAFGWEAITVDGHSFVQLLASLLAGKTDKPKVVIANTVKGKGVSFLENNPMAHTIIPSGEELEQARRELR